MSASLKGRLLIATPVLENTEFARAVIYICEHSELDGTLGITVNHSLPAPTTQDVLRQLDLPAVTIRQNNMVISMGGPVDPSRGFILYSNDGLNAKNVASLAVSMEILRDINTGVGPKRAMLALGHVGWDVGQLEEEITLGNAWLVAPATEELVFSSDFANKWSDALASIGVDPARLSLLKGEA